MRERFGGIDRSLELGPELRRMICPLAAGGAPRFAADEAVDGMFTAGTIDGQLIVATGPGETAVTNAIREREQHWIAAPRGHGVAFPFRAHVQQVCPANAPAQAIATEARPDLRRGVAISTA